METRTEKIPLVRNGNVAEFRFTCPPNWSLKDSYMEAPADFFDNIQSMTVNGNLVHIPDSWRSKGNVILNPSIPMKPQIMQGPRKCLKCKEDAFSTYDYCLYDLV